MKKIAIAAAIFASFNAHAYEFIDSPNDITPNFKWPSTTTILSKSNFLPGEEIFYTIEVDANKGVALQTIEWDQNPIDYWINV